MFSQADVTQLAVLDGGLCRQEALELINCLKLCNSHPHTYDLRECVFCI